jgi:hypothetical protein
MNDMTMRLIQAIDIAIQDFAQKNQLVLDSKNIVVIPARTYPAVAVPEIMFHAGGVKCSLEFRAYLADEPYRSISGYGSMIKEASVDTGQ